MRKCEWVVYLYSINPAMWREREWGGEKCKFSCILMLLEHKLNTKNTEWKSIFVQFRWAWNVTCACFLDYLIIGPNPSQFYTLVILLHLFSVNLAPFLSPPHTLSLSLYLYRSPSIPILVPRNPFPHLIFSILFLFPSESNFQYLPLYSVCTNRANSAFHSFTVKNQQSPEEIQTRYRFVELSFTFSLLWLYPSAKAPINWIYHRFHSILPHIIWNFLSCHRVHVLWKNSYLLLYLRNIRNGSEGRDNKMTFDWFDSSMLRYPIRSFLRL